MNYNMENRLNLCAMKHMDRKNGWKRLFATFTTLVALWLPCASHAQEMIRAIYDAPTTFSLARSYSNYKQWIVYDEYSDFSLFGRMDTSGYGNLFLKTRQQIHVKDMEISGDVLYFCGTMYNYEVMNNVGVMGYFLISQMSNPSTMSINYIFFNEFRDLRKLTVYDRDSTRHVPMVGTGFDGRDYIADAYLYYGTTAPGGGSWGRAWTYMPNIDAKFDDIIDYRDSIAISSRVEDTSEVQICFIEKTPLVSVPFFVSSGVYTTKVPDAPVGRVLLQTADTNLYAFYRHGPYLDVCQFLGCNNYNSFHIPVLATGGYFPESFTLKDVCVDIKSQNEMSVLLRNTYLTDISHRIYHIPVSLFPAGGSVKAHVYTHRTGYTPFSLCGGKNYHTVTMGKYMDVWGMARVVNPLFENCSELLDAQTREKKWGMKPIPKDSEIITEPGVVNNMPVEIVDYMVWQECGSYYMKDDNDNK